MYFAGLYMKSKDSPTVEIQTVENDAAYSYSSSSIA